MQLKDAVELQRRWGDKPCNHPSLDKEYESGMSTGDYVCTTCGQAGWGRHWVEKDKEEVIDKNNQK